MTAKSTIAPIAKTASPPAMPVRDPKLPSSRLRTAVATSKKFFDFMKVLAKDEAEAAVFYALFNSNKSQPDGMYVGEIVEASGCSQPIVSGRLIALRAKGFVASERQGQRVVNKIPDAWVAYLTAFVENAEKRKV